MANIIENILTNEDVRQKADIERLSLSEGEFEPWW
jgi:hypothetical protein